jgi:hypothetical protein
LDKISEFLVSSGNIKTYPLLNINHPLICSSLVGIAILILLYLIYSSQKDNYIFSVEVFGCFCLLGFSLLLFNIFEPLSVLFFILYGSLIATIFGLYRVRIRPYFLDNKEIASSVMIELIKIRISNWWKGLSLITNILIALFITALVSWVLNPPPENGKIISDYTLKSAFIFFISATPGLIYIYLKILKNINYLEKCILEFGVQK